MKATVNSLMKLDGQRNHRSSVLTSMVTDLLTYASFLLFIKQTQDLSVLAVPLSSLNMALLQLPGSLFLPLVPSGLDASMNSFPGL